MIINFFSEISLNFYLYSESHYFNFNNTIYIIKNRYTVKPVYNELGYNQFPVITQHIGFTDRIDFFKN
jgi:hypothetical protein